MVQYRIVWHIERGCSINSREKEIELSVIVIVGGCGAGIGFLIEDAALAAVVKDISFLRAEIAQEAGLGLVAAVVAVREIAGKQVEVAVVVEIAPAGADGMSAAKARRGGHGIVPGRDVLEMAGAVIEPEQVGLQAVIGHVNVNVPVIVEIGGGDAPGAVPDFAPGQLKSGSLFIHQNHVGKGRRFPNLVTADVEIDKAVVVEIAPAGAA